MDNSIRVSSPSPTDSTAASESSPFAGATERKTLLMKRPSVQDWGGGLGEILPSRKTEIRCPIPAGSVAGPTLEEIILQKQQRETQHIAASSGAESQNLAVLLANRPRRRLRDIQSTSQTSSVQVSGPSHGQ
jgi:hypothetical protein